MNAIGPDLILGITCHRLLVLRHVTFINYNNIHNLFRSVGSAASLRSHPNEERSVTKRMSWGARTEPAGHITRYDSLSLVSCPSASLRSEA